MSPNPSRLGFWVGLTSVFRGVYFIFVRPKTWPWASVPVFILITLSALFVWTSVSVVQPWIASRFGVAGWGAELVSWLVAVLAAIVGLVIALALTPPLSGPALERIVGIQERELGVPPRPELGILREMWCGLRAQVFAAIFALPILLFLWVIELVFPPAAVVTIPLNFMVVSLSIAWNLFDYPLTLRDVRMRERFSLVMAHKTTCLGFGAAFSIAFWVPCLGILLLPVGVAAATRLVWTILDVDRDVIPALPRADRDQDKSIAMPS
jgi:CysZ protein